MAPAEDCRELGPHGIGAGFYGYSDPSRAAAAIGAYSKDDAAKWERFTTQLRNLAGFLEVLYQTPAPDVDVASLGELFPLLQLGRKFRALGKRDMIEFMRTLPMSAWELVDDWFTYGPLKAAVAAGGIQDFQQGPRSGGTGFVLLHHLVGAGAGSVRGRVPWRNGPGAFTEAAVGAASRCGVTTRLAAPVAQIKIDDDAVTGVVLESGEEVAANAVLSTADPARTFLEWVDPVWLDPEFVRALQNVRHKGCTAFVMYALDTLPEFTGLASRDALSGLVSLTPDLVSLERAADAAKYGTVSERPHVELTVPTLLWPALAPSGRHVLVARVQYAPYKLQDGAAWDDARRETLAESVTSTIESVAPGFRSRIRHRAAWSPRDLEERFGLVEGASSQGELALDQILFMRPVAGWGRHATPVSGLYVGGAGTHPGPGVLGGAGWLAAERLLGRRA
jgi:phytoene dehydrogenase-like protein